MVHRRCLADWLPERMQLAKDDHAVRHREAGDHRCVWGSAPRDGCDYNCQPIHSTKLLGETARSAKHLHTLYTRYSSQEIDGTGISIPIFYLKRSHLGAVNWHILGHTVSGKPGCESQSSAWKFGVSAPPSKLPLQSGHGVISKAMISSQVSGQRTYRNEDGMSSSTVIKWSLLAIIL